MKTNQRGSTIIIVIMIMGVLTAMIWGALDYTSSMGLEVRRSTTQASAEAIANGALQHEFMYWREIQRESSNANLPNALPSSYFSGMPLPGASQFPNISNFTATASVDTSGSFTVSNYNVVAVTPEYAPLATASTTPPPASGPIASGTGGQSLSYDYLASVDVSLPSRGTGTIGFKARQVFRKKYTSPWNWAIFFVDPLEIHPGAPFTVTGPVQTNSDLYTAHSYLTFASQVTYGGSWYIGFMAGDSTHNADVPAPPNYPVNMVPSYGPSQEPFGLNTSMFNTGDSNPNNNGYHELIEQPVSGWSDPLAADRYYNQASIRVLVGANGTASIYKVMASGTTYTATQLTNKSSGNDKVLYTAFSSALTVNDTFQDNREGATMNAVDLNVGTIASAVTANPSGMSGFNGVVYLDNATSSTLVQNGSTISTEPAVRLLNGSVVPSGGLTVASDNPVYIQGDYNTGSNPPSNSGDPTQPNNANYTRQPCAVIADAVNILSNNWNDANSTLSVSSRVPTATTVNTAIISGIVPSGNGYYSGGAENFPRFLENWGGVTFTYYGSMVELYNSQEATGYWGSSNVYGAPNRKWYFDTNFITNPPPGTIMLITYDRMQWWQG